MGSKAKAGRAGIGVGGARKVAWLRNRLSFWGGVDPPRCIPNFEIENAKPGPDQGAPAKFLPQFSRRKLAFGRLAGPDVDPCPARMRQARGKRCKLCVFPFDA